jgi:hypothetical protein
MKHFSIEVQDNKVGFFIELMKSLNFVKVKETTPAIELTPDQKAELDKRYDEYKKNPDEYLDWNIISKNIEGKL